MQPPTQRAGPPPQEPGPTISRHQATDPGQHNPTAERSPAELRHRRAAATWAPRHRHRINRIFSATDPWIGAYRELTAAELRAFELATTHPRSIGLHGSWQIPASVAQTWRHRRCRRMCGRTAT